MARVGIAEAARQLGVSVDSIRRRIRKGVLPAQRDNKGQWWLELPDDAVPEPDKPSVQDRLALPIQVLEAATALTDALRGQVADLTGRLDRADARLVAMEADHRVEVVSDALGPALISNLSPNDADLER